MQFERECSLHRHGQPEYGQAIHSSTSDSMWQYERNKQILFNLMHQSFVSTAPTPLIVYEQWYEDASMAIYFKSPSSARERSGVYLFAV